jgi:acyl transferase domain-containing protein
MSDFLKEIANLSPQKLKLLCLELRAQLDAAESRRNEPIAVVGMACRFPGRAHDPDSFWRLMRDGVDGMEEVPVERWDPDLFYDDDPEAPGKMYTRVGGFVRGIDQFDPTFFDISPREAIHMDPQQRLLLEVAWEALENAGMAPAKLAGSRTGVYVGIFLDDYAKLQMRFSELDEVNAYTGTGNTFSVAAGRIAYLLGVHGPALALDTACSSSLVTVHLACQSLRSGESDMALAGGVNLILSPDSSIFLSKAKALSPDGRCKTFDAAADGYARSEGCGIVVLKRLKDALAQGDPVLAVIRGSAVNHDGASSGLTVPNGQAQVAVIREALASGGIRPDQVSYIEAHGTGTALGDPIEVKALATVFGPGRAANDPLFLGSVKTNIGHTESAAGVAGLMKLVLSLQHRELPPHLHFRSVNPHIRLEHGPFEVVQRLKTWEPRAGRRIAGVSSFGLSGTNAHVIVEEAPVEPAAPASGLRPLHVLALSAKSEGALVELSRRFATHLASHPTQSLADICYTANTGRTHFAHRLVVVGEAAPQFQERLGAFAAGHGPGVPELSGVAGWEAPKIAFLFTGQGAQYVGMGRVLWKTEPTFRSFLERCDELLRPHLDRSLLSVMHAESDDPLLDETGYTQPALFALECAIAEVWRSWGIRPSLVLGHSIGEFAAAYVAGLFSLEDGLRLVAERGRLMQALPRDGAMAAVFADEARVREALRGREAAVSIAAVNARDNVVVSGARDAVRAVLEELARASISARPLKVSHAFHSPLMDPVQHGFETSARQIPFATPAIGLVSNLTGRVIRDNAMSRPDYWTRQLREPVRFMDGVRTLEAEGCDIALEIGPAPVLIGLGQRSVARDGTLWATSLRKGRDDWQQMLETLGSLHVRGAPVDWERFDRHEPRRKVSLPTYPWQRKRYWIDWGDRALWTEARTPGASSSASSGPEHPVLGRRWALPASLTGAHVWQSVIDATRLSYATDHRIAGMTVVPVAVFLELAVAAGQEAGLCAGQLVVEDVRLHKPLYLQETSRTLQVSVREVANGGECAVHSREADRPETAWTLHMTSHLRSVQ